MTAHGYLKILNWKCSQSFSRWLQRQIHRLRANLTLLVCINTAEHNLEKKILRKKSVLRDATWRWFQRDNQGWEGPVCQLLVSQDWWARESVQGPKQQGDMNAGRNKWPGCRKTEQTNPRLLTGTVSRGLTSQPSTPYAVSNHLFGWLWRWPVSSRAPVI